jgi:hypothetical protein
MSMNQQVQITDESGNKIKVAPLLEAIGYDVYSSNRTPAYLAALVLDKCNFNQLEIIKLINQYYPLIKEEL